MRDPAVLYRKYRMPSGFRRKDAPNETVRTGLVMKTKALITKCASPAVHLHVHCARPNVSLKLFKPLNFYFILEYMDCLGQKPGLSQR